MPGAGSRAVVFAFAAAVSLILVLLAGPAAHGAVHERVKVSIPDPGQLAAARLQFKVKGDRTPTLKLKLKNARKLPDEVIAAAQMTRSTEKKGRAVALLAIANVPTAASRDARRVTGDNALVDVSSAGTATRISDITFQDVPGSRNFASVLGLEPGSEREQARGTFDIPETQVPDDSFGRFDLSEGFDVMELKPIKEARIVTRSSIPDDLQELFRERSIASAIAAAVGPPAVLDAELLSLVTATPPLFVLQSDSRPSPSNPSLYFVRVQLSAPVMGAQLSQAGDIDLLDGTQARCQNGSLNDGLVTRGIGPRLTVGLSYRLDCDLSQDHATVFYDVPLEQPPPAGTEVFKFLPFPYYGSMDVGEAVGGEGTTVLVKGGF